LVPFILLKFSKEFLVVLAVEGFDFGLSGELSQVILGCVFNVSTVGVKSSELFVFL
jgi:hypothetical protein